MSVSAVQMNEQRNPLAVVVGSTVVGGTAGYAAKYIIPLRKEEKADINYRAVVNASRKDVNRAKVHELSALKTRTEAQDAFVKMITEKHGFAPKTIAEKIKALGGDTKSAAKEFKGIIAEVDKSASATARRLLEACHNVVKGKRFAAPLIVAGAATGFAAAFIHNVFSYKNEA